jgi:hypothetical protein
MFAKIHTYLPLDRLLLYLVILGFLPFCGSACYYIHMHKAWEGVSDQLVRLQQLADTLSRKQYLNTVVKNIYQEADQFYLENHLESLSFLKRERESLEEILRSPTFTGNESAERRYAFLLSPANRLQWLQGNIQGGDNIQEIVCSLAHPIEVDGQDIGEILLRIEENRRGKPQLIITDCMLYRKRQLAGGNEVFEMQLKLLKREFTS